MPPLPPRQDWFTFSQKSLKTEFKGIWLPRSGGGPASANELLIRGFLSLFPKVGMQKRRNRFPIAGKQKSRFIRFMAISGEFFRTCALYWPHTCPLIRWSFFSEGKEEAIKDYLASQKIRTIPFAWKCRLCIFIYFCANPLEWGWSEKVGVSV